MHVERVTGRWRLSVPESSARERASLDAAARPAPNILAFRVANGHLPFAAKAHTEAQFAHGEQSVERESKRLDLNEPVSFQWPEGERALIFEVHAPRNQRRRLRVSGPTGLAWALFEPGVDGDWRSRASASAVGFADGTSQVKLGSGVWAFVLFHDSASAPGGPVEILFEDDETKAVPLFLADAHVLRRFVVITLSIAVVLSLGETGRVFLLTGNFWSTWAVWPIGAAFLLFPEIGRAHV